MFNASLRGRCSPRHARLAVIVAIVTSFGVAAEQARSEPAAPVAAQTAFRSDRLSVEVVGEGPDVILIPGLVSSREVWRATATAPSFSLRSMNWPATSARRACNVRR